MNTLTVSQLNTYIHAVFDDTAPLSNVFVVGEISNFHNHYASGHLYFTLKDNKSQIKCIMFASYASRIRFEVENGMKVLCRGRVSVYERDGLYQLYCEDLQPDGAGALSVAFEQLKARLEAQGLFDSIHKKPIPKYPEKIGVVTSNTGAAIEDIKNITKRRFPLAQLVIAPAAVQGQLAVHSISSAIKALDTRGDIDVIIVGRGGGSLEDLWAFNSEEVALAVFECSAPVISAVGHETDYTICDFVADLRAPTPSAAAELAVPDIIGEMTQIDSMLNMAHNNICRKLDAEFQKIDYLSDSGILKNPLSITVSRMQDLSSIGAELNEAYLSIINSRYNELRNIISTLDALSPMSVLKRGFSVVSGINGTISSVTDIEKNDRLTITLNNGKVSGDFKTTEVVKYEK